MTRMLSRPTTPDTRTVLIEDLQIVGLSLWRLALIAAVLGGIVTLGTVLEIVNEGQVIDFRPEHWILPGAIGVLLPIVIWNEDRFGAGFFWTLPVERRRHALTRVLAGWVWLIGAVALFLLWLLGIAVFSGGDVLAEEVLRFVSPSALATRDIVDPAAVRSVHWKSTPLLWLAPFTASTALYLLVSALIVGPRNPLRWIAATGAAFLLFAVISDVAGNLADSERLILAPSRVLESIVSGPYGLEMLLTSRSESMNTGVTLSSGQRILVWQRLPSLQAWLVTSIIWTSLGFIALWAAVSRYREHERE